MSNTWTQLDLSILGGNIRAMQQALSRPVQIIFVVKANAYGHGLKNVASHAAALGVQSFAVAHIDEAVALRRELPQSQILVLGAIQPDQVSQALESRISVAIADLEHGLALAASAAGRPLQCHIKVDTGMGRLGFAWETAATAIARLASNPSLDIVGLCSHFATSDQPDPTFAAVQNQRFQHVLAQCSDNGLAIPFRHISNSGGFLTHQDWDYDGVRAGLVLYGYQPPGSHPRIHTSPCFQWKTRIVQAKQLPADSPVGYGCTYVTSCDTTIAILDVGYSDGYPTRLGNVASVLIGGRRVPVVGRVSMNLTAIDLGSASATVKPGDEVVLMGRQADQSIWADEIAQWAETIPYEILTGIRTRDQRVTSSTTI